MGWGGLCKYEGRNPMNVNTGGRVEVMQTLKMGNRGRGGGRGLKHMILRAGVELI